MLQSQSRLVRKLRDALGERICSALRDVSVVEIMLNPDGRLFVERLGDGIESLGALEPGAAEIIIGSVAHPGGVTTIHSNSAISALRRLEQLTAEVSQQPMREVIGEAVDLVISIERAGQGRRVRDVMHVRGFEGTRYETLHHPQIDEESHAA